MLFRKVLPLLQAAGNRQWDDVYPGETDFTRDVSLGFLWVVTGDEGIVGVNAITTDREAEYADAGLDISEPAIVSHRLAVDPDCRGQGIAAMLLGQAEVVAGQQGLSLLRLDTNIVNHAAQRLFQKQGYVLAGEICLASCEGERFLCYEKRLA